MSRGLLFRWLLSLCDQLTPSRLNIRMHSGWLVLRLRSAYRATLLPISKGGKCHTRKWEKGKASDGKEGYRGGKKTHTRHKKRTTKQLTETTSEYSWVRAVTRHCYPITTTIIIIKNHAVFQTYIVIMDVTCGFYLYIYIYILETNIIYSYTMLYTTGHIGRIIDPLQCLAY